MISIFKTESKVFSDTFLKTEVFRRAAFILKGNYLRGQGHSVDTKCLDRKLLGIKNANLHCYFDSKQK